MDAFEKALSKIVGLDAFKSQLRAEARRALRPRNLLQFVFGRALGLRGRPSKLPHFLFLGNSGTGKTMVGLLMGELLHMVGIIPYDKVTVLQDIDLLYGPDGAPLAGPETRAKIKEAEGGVLFVDDVFCLEEYADIREIEEAFIDSVDPAEDDETDYVYAKKEILSFMDSGKGVVVFTGHTSARLICSNEAFRTRISIVSQFGDFSCEELAKILHRKMSEYKVEVEVLPWCLFLNISEYKLDPWCLSVENVAALIEQQTTPLQRRDKNGFLMAEMLEYVLINLDRWRSDHNLVPIDADFVVTVAKQDLVYGFEWLNRVTVKK